MALAAIYIFALVDDCILLFLSIYHIIALSDLECDYINATTCCSKLNKWVVPEAIAQMLTTLLLVVNLDWMWLLFTTPMTVYLTRRIFMNRAGYLGYYDPAEIHNRGLLKGYIKENMIKMVYYLIGFFIFLFCMIFALASPDDTNGTN